MKEQIPGNIKEERSKKLIKLSNENEIEYNKKYINKEVEVLIEEKKDGYYRGHTKNYILAYIKSDENLENKIIKSICKQTENTHIILEEKYVIKM